MRVFIAPQLRSVEFTQRELPPEGSGERHVVIEYKTAPDWTNGIKEKREEEFWAERSQGRCIFFMPRGPEELSRLAQLFMPAQRAATSKQWPRIESDPAVCGGEARIAGTRIPVWVLAELWRQGANDSEIMANYPRLEPSDLEAARKYEQANRAEIEREIREHESA